MLKLYDLTIEYKREPLGLDEVQPRFSWKLDTDRTGTVQTAYRIKVQRGGETVWDSGETESAQSILVEYLGLNLEPRTEYTWNVTVWDNHGEESCAESRFETGLLRGDAFEGKARWITHTLDKTSPVSPVLYREFTVTVCGRGYVSACSPLSAASLQCRDCPQTGYFSALYFNIL